VPAPITDKQRQEFKSKYKNLEEAKKDLTDKLKANGWGRWGRAGSLGSVPEPVLLRQCRTGHPFGHWLSFLLHTFVTKLILQTRFFLCLNPLQPKLICERMPCQLLIVP